jgi:tetratricopeptide (TPR) repeat protein
MKGSVRARSAWRWAYRIGLVLVLSLLPACSAARWHTPDSTIPLEIPESDLGLTSLERAIEEIDLNYREPRSDYRVEHSFAAAWDSISYVNKYEALWRAVRACAWLGENHPVASKRKEYATKGVTIGKHAMLKLSARVEPYYYTGLCYRALARQQVLPSAEYLEKAKYHLAVAKEIDGGFDQCGPLRELGTLIETTARSNWKGKRLGTLAEAIELLERACDGCPEFGGNQLALARALKEAKEYDRARQALDRVLAAAVPADYTVEHREWLHEAQGLRESIAHVDDTSVEATAYQVKE